MRNLIIAVVVLAALAYAVAGASQLWKAHNDFQEKVDQYCGAVTGTNADWIKQTLVNDAKKLGLKLAPGDIQISYKNAQERSLAQSIMGDRLGTQFVNKRATIHCRVVAPVLGLGISQEIDSSRLIQVKATAGRSQSEIETQMDTVPSF